MVDPATDRIVALCAGLTNYERDRPDRVRFGLESMRALLERPGAPQPPPRLVQVGGSKGKGTTAAYLAALVGGLRTGIYASPHVETVLERVVIDGSNVEESLLRESLEPILAFARASGLTVSFYEVMTAAALECFVRSGVELGVLEVGLGGRLDATTAVPVDASVLTTIELEHTDLLGDTIEAIAAEKAPVLRSNRPGIVGLRGDALRVAKQYAQEVGCALRVLGRDFELIRVQHRGSDLHVCVSSGAEQVDVQIEDAPSYEALSVALAWATLRELDPEFVPPRRIRRPNLPARFEVIEPGPWVLDGAHTEQSVALLVQELERRFRDRPRALVCGSAIGKDWARSFDHLVAAGLERVVVAPIEGTRCVPPELIRSWFHDRGVAATVVESAAAGVAELDVFDGLRVVTGSFYLAGSVRSVLGHR